MPEGVPVKGSRREPPDGETVEVVIPATKRRRRWCATCRIWTWERPYGSGKFYHGAKRRTQDCKGRAV